MLNASKAVHLIVVTIISGFEKTWNITTNGLMILHKPIMYRCLFVIGSIINMIAYQSLGPGVAAILFYWLGFILLIMTSRKNIAHGKYEEKMFNLLFATCWFMAGIATICTNYIGDIQFSDGFFFFKNSIVSNASGDTSLIPAMIILWHLVYEAFYAVGFVKEIYLGLLVNITLVAFSGVIAIKITHFIYGNDPNRFNRLITMFTLCGTFWLFAGLHLRDAGMLFCVTVLTYACVYWLEKTNIISTCCFILFMYFSSKIISLIRIGGGLIPLVMSLAALFSLLIFKVGVGIHKIKASFLILGVMIVGGIILTENFDRLRYVCFQVPRIIKERVIQESTKQGEIETSKKSLGTEIYKSPFYFRLIFGTAYLYLSPIPFWSGFKLNSTIMLFKTFNVLFIYALLPLFFLGLLKFVKDKTIQKPSLGFQLIIIIISTIGVVFSTIESRHIGAFFVPLFELSLLPNLSIKKDVDLYKMFCGIFLSIIVVGHLAWLVIKL